MSESPPDDELRALIAMEKRAVVDPGPARERLAARLGPLFVPMTPDAPPGPPSAPSPGLTGWKLAAAGLATFAIGGVTGAIVHANTAPPRTDVRYVDRVMVVEAGADAAAVAPSSSAPPPIAMPSERPARVERPASTPSATTTTSDEALARERQIIEKARSALARGDADGALAAVAEHSRAFPRGQLGEAREAIAVQALVRAGRHDEARARAARFHRSFPGSTYAPVIDAAISSIP